MLSSKLNIGDLFVWVGEVLTFGGEGQWAIVDSSVGFFGDVGFCGASFFMTEEDGAVGAGSDFCPGVDGGGEA